MTKKIKITVVILILLVVQIKILQAQMVGVNAYIKGTLVHIGIAGEGGFEGCDTTVSPTGGSPIFGGMHCRTNTKYFGFVANPQNNNWASFDGDFFTPGSPENGWGITIGNNISSAANNCESSIGSLTQGFDMPGSITNWSHTLSCYNVDWEGTDNVGGMNLDVKIDYLLEETDLFYTTTVSIKNNSADTVPDMYYYRNLDPDNNEMLSGSYTTQNTIVAQPGYGGCDIAHVKATQSTPWNSYVGFAAAGSNWRASYGGFCERNGYNMWHAVGYFHQTVGATTFADSAIQISYRIQNLAPGASETFKYVTILADSSADRAINNLMYFTYPGSTYVPPSACSPTIDTIPTCGGSVPIQIAGSAVNDYSWTWNPATGLSASTGDSVIANPSVSTSYTVTGIPLITGCGIPVSYSILVKVTPATGTITINPVPPQCINNPSINLTADTAGGIWSGDGITNSSLGTFNPAIAGVGNHIITYSFPGSILCALSDTVVATVYAQPTVTAIGDSICRGTQASITAAGALTYNWSGGAGNSATVHVSPTITTTYTVTGTDANGCSNTASCTVIMDSITTVSISASTNVSCNGGSNGSATASVTGGTPTYTYLWNTVPAQSTQTATGLSSGTYTVIVTDVRGCTKTKSVTISQPTPLIANISASTNVSCNGSSDGTAHANQTGGTPSYTYSWSNGQSLQTATGLSAGPYTVTVTDANGCTSTATVTINQPAAITTSITASTNVTCFGSNNGTATGNASGGSPTYSYLWNNGEGFQTATGLVAGTYTVTATDANNCTNTATVTITQPTQIVLNIVSFTNVSCFGGNNGSATVTATGGVPGYTYIWDDGETGQTADSLNPGVHSVTVMDANNCTKTTTVTITQPPQINMTEVTDSVLCYGQANGSITVTATGGTLPYASYIWNTGQSGSVASNLHVGTYTCTVTDANGCKDSIRAHVLQPLILTSIVINADTILPCYGLNNGTITIYVVGGTPPFTYNWNTGATGTMTLNNLSGGVYTDTITDHNGCKNIHTVVVTQPPALFVQIDSIPESCLNSCDGQLTSAVTGGTPFLGAGGSPYYHYLWNTTPPQTTESITGLCEGIYNLTITDSNGCQRIISNYLGVNDSVVAGFSAAPTSGYIPLTVNFLYTGTSSPANNYTWNFGDGTISSLENPTHIYTTADTFSVWLYITNGVCKDSIHIFVYPEIPSLLIVPNVFTPNGDGYNDEFMVKYQNIKTFSCVIFDRWGKKMYEWDDVTKGWDGKTKGGADCSDGTYFYILSAEGWDGLKYTDHGTVTLIR